MDTLVYGANIEMILIDTIRRSNDKAKSIEDLVAVFIGGTGGIGESTAKELFIRTTRPKAYIIGRNNESGRRICDQLHELNPEGTAIYLQKDVSTMYACDEICAELREREPKIHCLFLTAGFMALRGRTETDEGLDSKMCVNYYSRMRCILNLMPQLTAASDANQISRVITVLAAGSEGDIRMDDLDLKKDFTLHACLAHCVVLTDFMIEELAKRYPGTSFSHSYPGTVKTGLVNELSGPIRLAVKVLYAVMSPWILNVQESGERHFFQISSQCYPAARGGVGVPVPDGMSPMKGMDGQPGSGAYLLDWDGKAAGDEKVLRKYREQDFGAKAWAHTMDMFEQAQRTRRSKNKRHATRDPEGSSRAPPNPIGWRPSG